MGFWLPLRRRDEGLTITAAQLTAQALQPVSHHLNGVTRNSDLSAGSAAEAPSQTSRCCSQADSVTCRGSDDNPAMSRALMPASSVGRKNASAYRRCTSW